MHVYSKKRLIIAVNEKNERQNGLKINAFFTLGKIINTNEQPPHVTYAELG